MMILPKGIHIEFRNKNHPDNMDIEGIDNRHILDDRQNTVAVEEHTAVAAAASAAEAGIDNKHIQDVNDANVVDAEAEHIAGSMLLGVLQ